MSVRSKLLVAIIVVVSALTPLQAGYAVASVTSLEWSSVAPMPTARFGLGVAAANAKIYAIGGVGETNEIVGTNEVYDVATNSWSTLAPLPRPTTDLSLVSGSNGMLYAMGGDDYLQHFNLNMMYDPNSDIWVPKSPVPTPITGTYGSAVATPNGKIYIMGGFNNQGGAYKDVMMEYDIDTDSWTQKTSMPIPNLATGSALGPDGKIYIFSAANNANSRTVEAYDPVTDTWELKGDIPAFRWYSSAVTMGDKMYHIGGLSPNDSYNAPHDDALWVDSYDVTIDKWSAQPDLITSRYRHGSAVVNGAIYVIGGTRWNNATHEAKILSSVEKSTTISSIAAPQNLTINTDNGFANLSWDSVDKALNYRVYRNGILMGAIPDTTFTDTSGPQGSTSYYVTAFRTPVESLPSNSVAHSFDNFSPVINQLTWSNNPKATTDTATLTTSITDSVSGIQSAEYYLGDVDPGAGNGTSMSIINQQLNTDGTVQAADAITSFGNNLAAGLYKINVRAVDAAGNWSAVTSDYLVVFNPSGPTDVAASKKITPTIGDMLPGFESANQNDKADLAFDITNTPTGAVSSASTLSLDYSVGNGCKAHPQDCTVTSFRASTITPNVLNWLIINGQNSSAGSFQGLGTLTINSTMTTNPFTVTAIDGDRRTPKVNDDVVLKIYAPGANPSTDTALYQLHVNAGVNWVKIQ